MYKPDLFLSTRWAGTMQTTATSAVAKSLLPGKIKHDKPVSFHHGLMGVCVFVCMCVHGV